MWEIVNPPTQDAFNWIREVEDRLPPEDAALVKRIEFFPGSSHDAEADGKGAVAFPFLENERLIVINRTTTQDKKTLQNSLAHEVGHFVDFRDTGWEWHVFGGDVLFPNDDRLNRAANQIMAQVAEFYASGYAVKRGFMDHQADVIDFIRLLTEDVRNILA